MNENNKIPVIVGVTGHRDLSKINIDTFKLALKDQLQSIASKCPNTELKLLTSLSEGSDQLCAEVALELGISIIVPLPMEVDEYLESFNDRTIIKFNDLLYKAEKSFVVPYVEKCKRIDKDYKYRQAGIYIASHSNCLLALWDGSRPKENGCGTAEVVDMALSHSYSDNDKCIRNNDGFVIHLLTPRDNSNVKAGKVEYLGNIRLFEECISKIDLLNKEGGNADELSVRCGKKYHNALKLLAILGTVVTVAFLLYDEAFLSFMLVVIGIVFAFMYFSYRYANKSKFHERYIEYRALAECMRIQNHLSKSGYDYEVADYLDYNRCFDTLWIYKTMKIVTEFNTKEKSEDLRNGWLLEQYKYHLESSAKTDKIIKRNNTIVKISLFSSIALYIFAFIFEYVVASRLNSDVELIRTIIKTSIGGFSAASLFAANYYGKLSLERVHEDHVRMSDFFKRAIDYVDKNDINDRFIKELINEELSENSNWCSYEKDNKIDLTI